MSIEPIRRQSIISVIWQIVLTIIGFFSTIYFAHKVGADVLGAYFLFVAYFGIIGLVSDGGFGNAAIKRISEGEEADAFFSAYVTLRLFFAMISLSLLLLFRDYFVDLDNSGIFDWLILALIVAVFHEIISKSIAARGKMGIHSTAGFLNTTFKVIFQVISVYFGFEVGGLVGGFILGIFVGALFQFKFFDLHFVKFEKRHLKSLASFSLWAFLTSGGGLVFTYSDSVMIGYFLNNADVGVYRVIFQFTAFAAFTTAALNSTIWPRVSRWSKIGELNSIERSIPRVITYSLIIAIPMVIGGILLGDKLLYFLYGNEFANYKVLLVLLLVQIAHIFQYIFTTYVRAMDKIKDLFKVTIVAVVANLVLNALLIPAIGISGAAIATIVTLGLNGVLARRILRKMIVVSVDRHSLLNIFKAAFLMAIFVESYRLAVPLSSIYYTLIPVLIGIVIYGTAVLTFDECIREDLNGIMEKLYNS